jgi:hypothetical protein
MLERMRILENLSYMIHRHSSDTMSMRLGYKRSAIYLEESTECRCSEDLERHTFMPTTKLYLNRHQ